MGAFINWAGKQIGRAQRSHQKKWQKGGEYQVAAQKKREAAKQKLDSSKAIPMPRPMPGAGVKRPTIKKKMVGRGLVSKGAALAKSHAKEYGKQMVKHAGKKAIGSLKKALMN